MVRLLGFCLAFLFASSVISAEIIDLGPSDYRSYGRGSFHHTPGGINSKVPTKVQVPRTLNTLTVTRNPVVPYGSIANGAKMFTRINPASAAASAAITALFLGLDWVFDESLDSWMKEGEGEVLPQSGVWKSGGNSYDTLPEFCNAVAGNWVFTRSEVLGTYPSLVGECYGRYNDGPLEQRYTSITMTGQCPAGSTFSDSLQGCSAEGTLIDLDPSDWQRLESELPSFPASTGGQAASDIQQRQGAPLPGFSDMPIEGPASTTGPESTTTTTTETGDTVVTSTTTTTNYNYGDTTITTTNTTITNTYTNGSLTGSETTTETPGELPVESGGGGGGIVDLPPFCSEKWAKIVCDWIGWTQEPPPDNPDLPQVIDDDFYEEKKISFGAKACPPDYEINLPFLNTTVMVPLQPLCDFAGIIYYMVMAASYVIAAYISIGVARNG